MSKNIREKGADDVPARRTLRLTFNVSGGETRLAKFERLNMICPPQVGPPPEVNKNGGFWVEVRDPEGRLLFHRLLHAPLADTVEVHSPEGGSELVENAPEESTFEVLIPDYGESGTVSFMGEYLEPARAREARFGRARGAAEGVAVHEEGARELARFALPEGGEESGPGPEGGAQ